MDLEPVIYELIEPYVAASSYYIAVYLFGIASEPKFDEIDLISSSLMPVENSGL